MAVYQDKAKERIKGGLRRIKNVIAKAKEAKYQEADTRKVVTDVLVQLLGWNEYDNITCEQMIGSRYADYVVRNDDEQLMVIEVKAIGLKLKETHLNQARLYAIDEGIEWVVLTNGDTWYVYHMDYSGKTPETTLAFKVTLSDDTKPAEKTELLYLLSEEAFRKREITDYYMRSVALSGWNMANHIVTDAVLNKLRLALKGSTGQKLTNSEIGAALITTLFRPEYVTEEQIKALRKMQRSEKPKKD